MSDSRNPAPQPPAIEEAMEAEKRRRTIAGQDHLTYQSEANERLRMQAEMAHGALKGLTLANGGALVALFTFFGSAGVHVDRATLWWAFGCFGTGIAATLIAQIYGFFSQGRLMNATQTQAWNAQDDALGGHGRRDFMTDFRRGEIYAYVGVGAVLVALAAFIVGSGVALISVLP